MDWSIKGDVKKTLLPRAEGVIISVPCERQLANGIGQPLGTVEIVEHGIGLGMHRNQRSG